MCAPVGLEDRATSSSLKAMTESCSTDNCRFASAHLFSGSKLFRIIAQRKPCMYNVRQSLNQLLVGLAFLILIATRTRRSLSFLRLSLPIQWEREVSHFSYLATALALVFSYSSFKT